MQMTALGAARALQLAYMGDPYMTAPGEASVCDPVRRPHTPTLTELCHVAGTDYGPYSGPPMPPESVCSSYENCYRKHNPGKPVPANGKFTNEPGACYIWEPTPGGWMLSRLSLRVCAYGARVCMGTRTLDPCRILRNTFDAMRQSRRLSPRL